MARDVGLGRPGFLDHLVHGLLAEAQRVHDLEARGLGEHAEVACHRVEHRVELVRRRALYAHMRILSTTHRTTAALTPGNNIFRRRCRRRAVLWSAGNPPARLKARMAVCAASRNPCSAIAGRMLRSMPTIAPTNAFTSTSRPNWARFARMPSWIGRFKRLR